jgi:hypothetical protein
VGSPYRSADEEAQKAAPRAELLYVAGGQERHVAPARRAIQLGLLGTVGGVLAAAAGSPEAALGILVAAFAIGIWRWRRAPDVAGILLRVESGELTVSARGSGTPLATVRLLDLRNVSLDTKSIRKVEPGRDAIPAVQFINTSVGPEIDIARIVLDVTERQPIRLTEAYLSHMDTIEWVGKIRSFLRAHGWIPDHEREEGPVSSTAFSEQETDEDDDADDSSEAPDAESHRVPR